MRTSESAGTSGTGEASEPIPDEWTDGVVEANGIDLHYVRTGGDGPSLVISHGVFDDGLCRAPLAREFADECDVILYDARGHGQSDAPDENYGPQTRATDLLGLIDALDLDEPILLGHSMGGDTVAAAAARAPAVPRATVLVDPAAMLEHDEDRQDRVEAVREQLSWWADRTKAALLDADDELRNLRGTGRTELASRLADARLRLRPKVASVFEDGWVDTETIFPEIGAPTLVLRADGDDADRERDRERTSLLPNGRLVHVEGAGHCIFRDEREAATRELRAFLDEV